MPESASHFSHGQQGSTAHEIERVATPVLFLIFNRPELTKRSFAAIRHARPKKLYVAADGPRRDRAGEAEKAEAARQIATSVDWECDVRCLFRDDNLGCQKAVSEAITWMFETEQQGIILEDDCVADPSFFRFCDEMLERYAEQPEVGVVTGNNFQRGIRRGDASYYFSKYNHCWGWATWNRAWEKFDYSMRDCSASIATSVIDRFATAKGEQRHWKRTFRNVRRGKINSWAFRWTYSCWSNQLLTITPAVNLVENIGFGDDATHTKETPGLQLPKRQSIAFPLIHPTKVAQCADADEFTTRKHFKIDSSLIAKTHRLIVDTKKHLNRK